VSDRAINDFLNFLRIENTDDESFEFFKFILRKQNKFGRRRKSIEIPYSGYVLADGSRLSFALKTVANRYRFELDRRGNLQLAYQGVGQEQPEFVVHKVQQLESNENVEVIEIPGIPTAFVLDRKTGHVQPNSIKWARKVFDFKEPDLKRVRIPLKK